jgi:hypothetical protein
LVRQAGKKRKIENEKTEKSKEYEARRKERSFNQQWLVGRGRNEQSSLRTFHR